ncbi:MAG: hypothetical protein ACI9XO_000105 [Paraglaciecola sp.]|jgi:hypothetical protein
MVTRIERIRRIQTDFQYRSGAVFFSKKALDLLFKIRLNPSNPCNHPVYFENYFAITIVRTVPSFLLFICKK